MERGLRHHTFQVHWTEEVTVKAEAEDDARTALDLGLLVQPVRQRDFEATTQMGQDKFEQGEITLEKTNLVRRRFGMDSAPNAEADTLEIGRKLEERWQLWWHVSKPRRRHAVMALACRTSGSRSRIRQFS